jgi:hypothetical protein
VALSVSDRRAEVAKQLELPPISFGLASIVLGAVGLMMFVIPVLAIPVGVCGLAAGVIGMIVGAARDRRELRSAVAGIALCCLAVGLDVAVNYAPKGYSVRPSDPALSPPLLPKTYIAPPAPFQGQRPAASGHVVV